MGRVMQFVCHQRPDRSFHWRGKKFPLCSRCTGIYIFLVIGVVAELITGYGIELGYTWVLLAGILSLVPMAIDGFTQLWGWRESNNVLRLITGIIGGFFVGVLLMADVELILYGF